jgi:tRNA(fMet)-specific endonuclease VapC
VKPALTDTDILSLFFRNNPNVVAHFQAYQNEHIQISISIITYYEILSGLKHRDARKQLAAFLDFAALNTVLPLTEKSVSISAEIYSNLRSKGTPVDDIDILIAGVAISNNLVLVTRNNRHFGKIENLSLEDWSQNLSE